MNVISIVKSYLLKHKFDGLFYPNNNCKCDFNTLMECNHLNVNCTPGYKIIIGNDYNIVPETREMQLEKLVRAVQCGDISGLSLDKIEDKNWFDYRREILSKWK